MPSKVGERGQITIEKAIREELGVYAGDQAVQWVEDGHVVVTFVPAPHRRSAFGILADKITKRPDNEDDWSALIEEVRSTTDPDLDW
jgi:AbrB family looped-hinge helix DNA binding protein